MTVTEDRWSLKPSSVVITRSDVLIQQAGSRYSWWVPLLAALKNAVVERKFRRIAVVGVPCAVQALARIRTSDNDLLRPYAKSIRLVIGLFCTETFDYTALVQGKLRTHYKLEPHEIRKLDVKGKLEILKQDGSTATVPLAELETCIRKGCHYCTDLTAVFVRYFCRSLSGAQRGRPRWSSRTPVGKGFVNSAVAKSRAGTLGCPRIRLQSEKLALAKIRKNTKA